MQQVGMTEILKIFEITDPMGIHRESLMIPLGPQEPRLGEAETERQI